MKVIRKIGSGITSRTARSAFLGDPREWHRLSGLKPAFEDSLLEIVMRSRRALLGRGESDSPDGDEEKIIAENARKAIEGEPFGDPAWYAATLLRIVPMIRRLIGAGKASEAAYVAFRAGLLAREWETKERFESPVLAHRRSRAGAKKGGSASKRPPAVLGYIKMRLSADPSCTAAALWESIPKGEDDARRIGNAKLFRESGSLIVARKKGKDWLRVASFSDRSFREYVKETRPTLSR